MSMNRGTPKNINGAIKNALDHYKEKSNGVPNEPMLRKILKNHILDFNRNVTAIIMISEDELTEDSQKAIRRLTEPKK